MRDVRKAGHLDAELVEGDLTRPETLAAAVQGADVVFSCVGAPVKPMWLWRECTFDEVDRKGNLALLDACGGAGVRKVVYVSVFGDYPQGMRYVEAHRDVADAIADSGLEYTIVEPTGFSSSLLMLVDVAIFRVAARVGSGASRTNPIDDRDLAQVCVEAIDSERTTIAAGGPDVLSRREITELAFRARGVRPWFVPVPAVALRLPASLIRPFNRRLGDILAFFAHVLAHDGVAPRRGSRTLLGSFEEYASRAQRTYSGGGHDRSWRDGPG